MDRFLGQKTVFIGGGRMGEAIFSGLLSNGILKAEDLTVRRVAEDSLKTLIKRLVP